MIRKFNDSFINEFLEDDYIRCLNTINYLDVLRNNYNSRYEDDYAKFNGTINMFKESLDHYVLKRMSEDEDFINLPICNNYFSYLRKLSNVNSYDFYTNIVLFNVLNDPKFIKYKVKYGLNSLNANNKFGLAMVRIDSIIKKAKVNGSLTQEELNLLCGFVSDYRENTETLNITIRYIFNNLTKSDCKLECSSQVIAAIATYIPYKCSVIRKNGFEPSNVRIYIANKYHYYENDKSGNKEREYKGMGASLRKRKHIILPANVAKKTNFKSIVSSENSFSFDEYFRTKNYSFTLMLLTLYHEITHQYQTYMSRKKLSQTFVDSDVYKAGLPMALCDLLDYELGDYKDNHDGDDIEIHATQVAWEMCNDFYKDILLNDSLKRELITRCGRNKNATQGRYGFSSKKDKAGNLFDSVDYTLTNCSLIMKDAKKREKYFEEIPSLRYIFNDEGKYRLDILFVKDFGYTQIGAGLLERMINAPNMDLKITKLIKERKPNSNTISIMAANIYMGIKLSSYRLYMIEFYTRKDMADSFQVDRSFLEVVDKIIREQEVTVRNGKRILHNVLNCYDHDDSIETNIRLSLHYYKNIITNINNSKNVGNKGKKNK